MTQDEAISIVAQIKASTSISDLVLASVRISECASLGKITPAAERLLTLACQEKADEIGRRGIEEFRNMAIGEGKVAS